MISMPVNVELDENKINKDSKSLDERAMLQTLNIPQNHNIKEDRNKTIVQILIVTYQLQEKGHAK